MSKNKLTLFNKLWQIVHSPMFADWNTTAPIVTTEANSAARSDKPVTIFTPKQDILAKSINLMRLI